jgi:predicted metal-dependent peptidase
MTLLEFKKKYLGLIEELNTDTENRNVFGIFLKKIKKVLEKRLTK